MPQTAVRDEVGRDRLRELVGASGLCVSMFLPTHRAGAETNQDPIRLKNLLREAEQQLEQRPVRPVEARELLEPARRLIDDYGFWQHQSDGLAVFVSRERFQSYRVPIPFPERVIADDHFCLKPLLPLLSENDRFYILAVSQKRVRLLQCTRFSAEEMPLDGMPTSMEEAMKPENIEADNSYQIFGNIPATGGPAGRQTFLIGRGRADVDPKNRLQEYFRKIDAGICERIKGKPGPLILAAVELHHALYRPASSCSFLHPQGIPGNPDLLRPEQLLEQALPLVEPHLSSTRERDRAKFLDQLGTGLASNETTEIVPSILQGRVEALFAAQRTEQWGRIDPETWEVQLHAEHQPGDADLVDFAAVQAWLYGGRVYLVPAEEVPGGKALTAVYRY